MSYYWTPLRDESRRYWQRVAERREAEERSRREWVSEVKQRLGIVCIGDEPGKTELADYVGWPKVEEGATYTVVSEHAMASLDGVNFYVKPDDMTFAEFLASLPQWLRPTWRP
jgi:hypothetical protein